MKRVIGIGIAAVAFAGCGSSSSGTAAVSKTRFCADNAKLDKVTASVTTLPGLLKVLKANQATINDFSRAAPSVIKAQAQVLVTESDAAIKSGSATAFNAKKFGNAGMAVDAYCGQGSTSTSTSS